MPSFPTDVPLPSNNYSFELSPRLTRDSGSRSAEGQRQRDGGLLAVFSVSWELTSTEFASLNTFWGTTLSKGQLPFTMSLARGDQLEDTTVRFRGPLGYRFNGQMYSVTASLFCHPLPLWSESLLDEWLAVGNIDFLDYLDRLETLIETDFPSYL